MTTVRSDTITRLLGDVPPHFGHPILTVDEMDWTMPIQPRPDRWDEVLSVLREMLGDDYDYQPWRD